MIFLNESIVCTRGSGILVAAQNCVWDDKPSFTGETSAKALVEIGVTHVVLGHSERRIYLSETDEMISKKVATTIHHKLVPILCVGETHSERKAGGTASVIEEQLNRDLLPSISNIKDPGAIVLAYEPAWAISTSSEATPLVPELAQESHAMVRAWLTAKFSRQFAAGVCILYGGSVSGKNAESYFREPDIDGGLVGSASQSLNGFEELIHAATRAFEAKA